MTQIPRHLAFERDHGLLLTPVLVINGKFKRNIFRGYDQLSRKRFFGTLEIPVGMDYLKEGTNLVVVKLSDKGEYINSVILQV